MSLPPDDAAATPSASPAVLRERIGARALATLGATSPQVELLLEDPGLRERITRVALASDFAIETLRRQPALLAHLAAADISARRGIMAAHRQPAYAAADHVPLPVTEHLTDTTLILPVFHQMSESEQARVIDALVTAGA